MNGTDRPNIQDDINEMRRGSTGRNARLTITVILVIVMLLAMYLLMDRLDSYESALNANWGLSFSEAELNEIYSADTGASFNGDGIRYHVFTCGNAGAVDRVLRFAESDGDGATVFYDSRRESCEAWLGELGIEREKRPDYDECVSWYSRQNDSSEIIIYFNVSELVMYVVESFM